MRRVCVPCGQFFQIKKNGVVVEEKMPLGIPGPRPISNGETLTVDEEGRWIEWKPYKLYMADLYECPACHTELAICTSHAYAEHYMPHYGQERQRAVDQKNLIETTGC